MHESNSIFVNPSGSGTGQLTITDDPAKRICAGDPHNPLTTWIGSPFPLKAAPDGSYPIDCAPNPWLSTVTVTSTSATCWRVIHSTDQIRLSLDVPGLRAEELSLEIENGTVRVTGRRHDTGFHVNQVHFIGADFDPKSAEATLECGVLSLSVLRFRERVTHRVSVTQK